MYLHYSYDFFLSRTRPRELEVAKFNNTIMAGDDIRIFSYYWRIDHFQHKLQSNVSVIYSPVFSISGSIMHVSYNLNLKFWFPLKRTASEDQSGSQSP